MTPRLPRPLRRLVVLTVGCLLLVAPALPALAGKPSGPPKVGLEFEKYTLPNGLEVILQEDHRLPIVGVNIWYHVGAANEVAGRTGFAHLFEHMMFQASGHVAEDQYFKILQSSGSSIVNGSTSFDRTNYLEDVPANHLATALWLESDRMGFLLDKLDARMLARQQDVVRNERRQRLENSPYGLAGESMYQMLFPKEHPYYSRVMGSHDDIQAAKLEDVRDFFRRYYCPNNATLCLVGDFQRAQAKALVAKYFGTIARGEPVPPIQVAIPSLTSERRLVVTDKVELPRVQIGWITPSIFQPGDAEGEVAAWILAGGKASRLYESLVYRQKIAQSVAAEQDGCVLGSTFQITVTAKPGHTVDELEQAIDAELAKLAAEGPTAAELQAARSNLWGGKVQGLEPVGGFGGRANTLNAYNHYLKDPGRFNWDLARYGKVDAAGVKRFVTEQLRRDARAVVHCLPGEKVVPAGPPAPPFPPETAASVVSAEPWRNERPQPGPVPTAALPAAKRFTLGNGLPVYLVEDHLLPVVGAQLVLRAGSASDPAGREGLAAFTASMLDEGAGARDALAIARLLEQNGCSIGTSADLDGSFASGATLKQNADVLMGVLSDVVLRPTFPADDLERVRNDRITALQQQRDNPAQTARRVAVHLVYGETHPYGHVPIGTETALRAVTRDDMLGFYRDTYTPANAGLVLAGDLTEKEARRLAEKAFGSWHGEAAAVVRPAVQAPLAPGVFVVDKAGATQTTLICGHPVLARSDPDFEPLRVMNVVLGGNFASRLNMNLREDKGYTYGARTYLEDRRGTGLIYAQSNVQGDKSGAALAEVFKEFEGIRAAEVTPAELMLAKEALTRTLPADFQTSRGAVSAIANLFLYDLPPDYYQNLTARVQAITAAEILAAARRHVDPAHMRAVLVGDAKSVLPQLTTLDRGPVTQVGPDGKPLAP